MLMRPPHRPAPPEKGLKISVQYRAKRGKVFELTDGAMVLSVSIMPEESGPWRVEARIGTGMLGPSLAEGAGDTAAEALTDVATAWRAAQLAILDWDAITRVLRVVNAV
jgi:hypothetical protein